MASYRIARADRQVELLKTQTVGNMDEEIQALSNCIGVTFQDGRGANQYAYIFARR